MTLVPLKYLSEAILAQLRRDVSVNRERYKTGDFRDLERSNGWAIEAATVQADMALLARLAGEERSADADVANAIVLHQALKGLTPAMAREERVWARLTHVECLPYSRARWLDGQSDQQLEKAVQNHMFARGIQGIRDDNALSRLWWSMHIASIADPEDPEGALHLIGGRADRRMQFVERSNIASRPPLARAVLRAMRRDPWLLSGEQPFRHFMTSLNRDGGGVLFEVLSEERADQIMDGCLADARERSGEG